MGRLTTLPLNPPLICVTQKLDSGRAARLANEGNSTAPTTRACLQSLPLLFV